MIHLIQFLTNQKNSLKKSKILITPTQSSKNDIANLFSFEKKRIEVIWNGINIKKVEPFKPKKFTSRLVSIISSDVPMKNLEIVLKSLKDLSDQGINIKLKIIGDLREKNNNLIKQLEIADKIEFLPKLSKDQLIQNLDDADIGICPSIYEGFGFPLVEMMSRGLPVIASNGGSLPELLSNSGLTFNPFDKDELTVKIKQMLENTKLRERFALNSLNRMDDFFDWDEYAMKLEPLYQKILSGHF
jgi:glycosyltransferase involved in cell wall biosynthesis